MFDSLMCDQMFEIISLYYSHEETKIGNLMQWLLGKLHKQESLTPNSGKSPNSR